MKTLVFGLLPAAVIYAGCAGKQQPDFRTPPGPSAGVAGGLPEPTAVPPPAPPVTKQKKAASRKSDLIVTPEKAVNGKVATYNDVGRFVVLDFPSGRMPAVDQRMFLYRQGLKTGEVKINSWQKDRYVVADLIAGEAQSGDEVREK